WCNSHEKEQQYLIEHPEEAEQILQSKAELEAFTQEFVNAGNRSGATNYIIPMVFHIIHENGSENISDQKVHDQVARLNADFNGYNSDTATVVAAFKPIVGNANFQFVLAQLDPNGNPTTGIVRYDSPDTEAFTSQTAAGGRIWPREMYLNIFVVKCLDATSCANPGAAGTAAYTNTPGGFGAGTDGVYCRYVFIGGEDRTLTHELGHWFNLSHTWGPTNDPGVVSNCSFDDNVSDTPNTEGELGGCDIARVTCGSLDNTQNYMDYASCSQMFTDGQVSRMAAALESSTGGRNNLWTESNLIATGLSTLFGAQFLSNNFICNYGNVQFYDQSLLNGKNSWIWSFQGGTPSNSAIAQPQVYYGAPGLYDVTLNVGNGTTTLSQTKTMYILVSDPINNYPPILESFETISSIPNEKWFPINEQDDIFKFELSNAAAYTGNTCLKMANYWNGKDNVDEFVSAAIDLSPLQSVDFTFKVAYAQHSNTSSEDKLRLYISNDCGGSWSIRLSQTGSALASTTPVGGNFTPADITEWKEYSVGGITSSFLTENFMFKFVFESDSGNNMYIDDINIQGVWDTKPELYLPLDGAGAMPDNEVIDWKSVDGVDSYEWELDTTDLFNSGLYQTGTKLFSSVNPNGSDTEFETENLVHGQKYYWRVRTNTNSVASDWSDIWDFTVATNGVGFEDALTEEKQFSVYPNPTSSIFTIQNINANSVINVYDLLGQLVYASNSSTNLHSVDVSTWNKGVYLVEVGSVTKKVIVQ
ncbi:MAG: T9SS type A sorting domain-containing protein, partial [Flavobacteriales bacterium]|nr:T9SS type A sorting domain-containing protein [Flavobacteriales bacterium]